MNPELSLNLSRIFKCDAKTLFNAIGEGVLFKFTGALMDKSSFDFKEGGKYHLEWNNPDCGEESAKGEFKQITPYSKIVFTWNFYSKLAKKNLETLVTIVLKENNGKTTLTLDHSGFTTDEQVEEHNWGWSDAIKDLYNSLRKIFFEEERNNTGLDLHFKMKQRVPAPLNTVFKSVIEPAQLSQYFNVQSSGPFKEGHTIQWEFGKDAVFNLCVHQVIENKLIKFQWGESHVCLSFRATGKQATEVTIDATGWSATQEGLDDSYDECEGWREFLMLLKSFHEAGTPK